MGSGAEMDAASYARSLERRSSRRPPVATSSSMIAGAEVDPAPRNTTRPPSTATPVISVNGNSCSVKAPSGAIRNSRSRPRERPTATIEPSSRKPYFAKPNCQSG